MLTYQINAVITSLQYSGVINNRFKLPQMVSSVQMTQELAVFRYSYIPQER